MTARERRRKRTAGRAVRCCAFVCAVLVALAFPSRVTVAQDATPDKDAQARIEERQRELDALREQARISEARTEELAAEVEALEKDRKALNEELVGTAERVAQLERRISDSEERLGSLSENEHWIRQSLNERRGVIAEILAALQRIGVHPPPAIAVKPEDALSAVRSAILLGAVVPELNTEAEALAADLNALTTLKAEIASERARLAADLGSLTEERTRVELLIAEKKKQREEKAETLAAERQKAEELAGRADSLEDLIASLEDEVESARSAAEAARAASAAGRTPSASDAGRLAPAIPFAKARGRLPLPAEGAVLRTFGEPDATGDTALGISIATLPDAQIVAPADGWVVYAGPFRSYGQLLILNVGGGYHVLLAGMKRTEVQLGQFVLAGEPVGVMGAQRFASAATMDIESPRPVLYVEFRKDGTSIDPAPWWADRVDEEVRG
ncbi:murein hydrolase activator EnvC [Amorphus sp. 3PC139-8]|uniref:murein hydrolase activator EnvC family protein n=1 Tax=Amorphus sp. 3PC139-8 TaxID=2735676 RepID=UPI00345C6C1B